MRTYAFLILFTTACSGADVGALTVDGGAGSAGEAGAAGFGGAGGTAGSSGEAGAGGEAGSGAAGSTAGTGGSAGAAGGTAGTAGSSGSAGAGSTGGDAGSCTVPTCNWQICPWDMTDPKLKGFVPCCMTECGPCGYRDNTGTSTDVCFVP